MVATSIQTPAFAPHGTPLPPERIMASSQGGFMTVIDARWGGAGAADRPSQARLVGDAGHGTAGRSALPLFQFKGRVLRQEVHVASSTSRRASHRTPSSSLCAAAGPGEQTHVVEAAGHVRGKRKGFGHATHKIARISR